jgi:hypothetical protein
MPCGGQREDEKPNDERVGAHHRNVREKKSGMANEIRALALDGPQKMRLRLLKHAEFP